MSLTEKTKRTFGHEDKLKTLLVIEHLVMKSSRAKLKYSFAQAQKSRIVMMSSFEF